MHIYSKWKRTRALLQNNEVAAYVLPIKKMTRENLQSDLQNHRLIYVKPVSGTYGHGVMRVEKNNHSDRPYQYQSGTVIRKFSTFERLYRSILKHKRKRPYLIQQGIELLKYKGRRFDIRVMVQSSPEGVMRTTGIIARLGHPKRIVTNYHSGGIPRDVADMLTPHLQGQQKLQLIRQIRKIGFMAAKQLNQVHPQVKEVGVDIGLDENMRPWIIEVNTRPDPFIFRKLNDRSIFRKVLRYHRHNNPTFIRNSGSGKKKKKSLHKRHAY